jgi:hypothetical protein
MNPPLFSNICADFCRTLKPPSLFVFAEGLCRQSTCWFQKMRWNEAEVKLTRMNNKYRLVVKKTKIKFPFGYHITLDELTYVYELLSCA